MKIDVYTSDGAKKGTKTLPAELFGVEINVGLMHDAATRQQANSRVVTAATKTRSNVKGGGAKPWRQKGTGRARQGSIRSAQWRGGGVIFGPDQDRNYSKQMPKKMRRKALLSALSARANDKIIAGLESFENDTPKTKMIADLFQKIGYGRNVLIVIGSSNPMLEKSVRNLQNVKLIRANYLNIVDIMSADHILFVADALEKAQEIFSPKK
jgi:large subunit ribosomal protein L4